VSATPPASLAGAIADQAAHALALVFEREPRTLAELAEAIGVSEPEAAALLAGLERHELIASDASGSSLSAGPAALRFARVGALRQDLLELAAPALERLARESGETANLIVPVAAGTEAIAQADGRHLLGATNWLGRALPLHCTAAGKLFLAHGVAQLPDGPLSALTPASITDRDELLRQLDAIREQGYATLVDELEEGLSAVGAPVRAAGGVIAALTVSGATVRLPPARLALLGRLALEQARAVSATLVHGTAEL
jgi:IclR family acetate operon transcriptional repressor